MMSAISDSCAKLKAGRYMRWVWGQFCLAITNPTWICPVVEIVVK